MTAFEQIAHLAEVPIDMDVQLGRTMMTVETILALDIGSVIKMGRSAGENIDVLIGKKLVGSGEIVLLEESFGVRITDFVEES